MAMGDATVLGDGDHALLQMLNYLERLKLEPNGWKRALDAVVSNQFNQPYEHFILLSAIEHFLLTQYATTADAEAPNSIRTAMAAWLQRLRVEPTPPTFLVNKMARLFALTFVVDFPVRWPRFMHEVFLANSIESEALASFFLKTLMEIDKEVVDREISRPRDMLDRNSRIKDAMRELCVVDIAQWWVLLLEKWAAAEKLVTLCLQTMAVYVDWIEVELLANERVVSLLANRLLVQETAESAAQTVVGIVNKKMPPEKKLALVNHLTSLLQPLQVLNASKWHDFEDVSRTATVLNSIIVALLDCSTRVDKTAAVTVMDALHVHIDNALVVFANDDNELAALVADAMRIFAQHVRPVAATDPTVRQRLVAIVETCMAKWAFPKDVSPLDESETTDEMIEFREDVLRPVLSAVGQHSPAVVVDQVELALQSLTTAGATTEQHAEAVVSLIHHLADFISPSFLGTKDETSLRAVRLIQLGLADFALQLSERWPAAAVETFETACRYNRLMADPLVIHRLISLFLSAHGLFTASNVRRARIVYLFAKFVKENKARLLDKVGEVVAKVTPLLGVAAESDGGMCTSDQTHLWEATAVLVLGHPDSATNLRTLVGTLLQALRDALLRLHAIRSAAGQPVELRTRAYATVAALVSYTTRIAKAFNPPTGLADCGSVELFVQVVQDVCSSGALSVDETLYAQETAEVVLQLLHRLTASLELHALRPAIAPALPLLIGLARSDPERVSDLIVFAQQLLKLKKDALGSDVCADDLLRTAISAAAIGANTAATAGNNSNNNSSGAAVAGAAAASSSNSGDEHTRRAQQQLRRSFAALTVHLFSNELMHVLAQPAGLGDAVFAATLELAADPDLTTQRSVVSALRALARTDYLSPVLENVVTTVCRVPLLAHVLPLKDAQSMQLLHDVGLLLAPLVAESSPLADRTVAALQSTLGAAIAGHLVTALRQPAKLVDGQLAALYEQLRTVQQQQQ